MERGMVGEELTRKTFGDYIGVYNFKQSVDDNATVPLYYENRIPEVQLKNEDLNEEEKRVIAENLSEEELAIFNLLHKPELTDKEKKQVKNTAKRLLEVLKKEKLVLDWRKRQQTRADVLLTIRTVLDEDLPRSYSPQIYQEKCDLVYQHFYESYYGAGKSLYRS